MKTKSQKRGEAQQRQARYNEQLDNRMEKALQNNAGKRAAILNEVSCSQRQRLMDKYDLDYMGRTKEERSE